MSMQVDASTCLAEGFEICPHNAELSGFIKETIERIRYPLSKFKYGSEHPYLALALCRFAWMHGGKKFLEVGIECGGTTIPLSMVCEELGGTYLALDNQESMYCNEESLKYIEREAAPCVTINSESGFDTSQLEGQYDFIFMDHAKQRYGDDFRALVEGGFLAPGALAFFHDVDFCRTTNGINVDPFAPIVEYVEAEGLGECHYLRKGYKGVTCPDLGLVVLRPKQS